MRNVAKFIVLTAILALSAPFGLMAQECPAIKDRTWQDLGIIGGKTALYRPVTTEERNAVMDVLSLYAWAMDNRDSTTLSDLFTDEGAYLLCRIDSENPLALASKPGNIAVHFDGIFATLNLSHAVARRVFSNVLMGKRSTDEIDVMLSVVVFIQSLNISHPQIDYTANIFATLKFSGTVWKLKIFKVITDDTGISIRAR
jgi:hypothetical protein